MRLLAITRKPDSASFEQRVLRFIPLLAKRGISVEWRALPTSQSGQFTMLGDVSAYDGVWWHRHLLSPWWLQRLRTNAKRLVFDFDDPLIYTARGGGQPSLARKTRFRWMLAKCDAAFAASNMLADLSREPCPATHIVPMAIDVPASGVLSPRWSTRGSASRDRPELLWLGSAATQPYLELIRADLESLGAQASKQIKLRLVAHAPMKFGSLAVDFRPWSPDEQERALLECDIGLCPMPDTVWTRGKCPFKVLQYMAYGMPWVGSAVGENIVTSGGGEGAGRERGLCVGGAAGAWVEGISALAGDAAAREQMGRRGRAYVEATHDRAALVRQLESLWRGVIGEPAD